MKNAKKGFTLVELLVVIAIIAILATVSIVSYVSFINRANMSVDQQVVDQMNKVFAADEIVADKPSTVVEAKNLLIANRLDDFSPIDERNVFYWVRSENRVVLWTKDEVGSETGKVSYPKEYAKKYKDVTTPSADWGDLSLEYDVLVEPSEGESLRSALLNAVKEAPDGAVLRLPENSTVDLGAAGLYFLGSYMTNAGGTGKALTIDLNGSTIESLTPYSNGYYYGGMVPDGGSLTLLNGTLDAAGNINTFEVGSGSSLVLKNMNITTDGDGIFPDDNAGEIVLDNCVLDCAGNYAIATNNTYTDNLKITITNSTIKSASACAILVNVPCDVYISGSDITGKGWGIIVRSGHAVIENTTIRTTDGDPGADDSRTNTSCEYFAYNQSTSDIPYWGQGPQVPYAPLIVGDYSSHNAYNHDTDCKLTNVTFVNANSTKIPDVVVAARPEGKDVVLNYDSASNVNRVVLYGNGYVRTEVSGTVINHTFEHKGTVTVNGESKTLD